MHAVKLDRIARVENINVSQPNITDNLSHQQSE